jgi:GntR family transcriptional regulator
MVLVTSCIPAEYMNLGNLVHEDLTHNSLYKIMEQHYHVPINSSRRVIEIRSAGDFEAQHLRIPKHAPLQYIETISTTINNIPIEYSKASYRGDLSRFIIEIRKKKL